MSDKLPPESERAIDTTEKSVESSEEFKALVKQIMEELESNRPIKCPVQFHWQGDQDLAEKVLFNIQVQVLLLQKKHHWLNFDSLESIIFHHDYAAALREVSERAGREYLATSENTGVGVAMVVHLKDSCVAILDAGIALGIADEEDEERSRLCMDVVLHELCHVHDNGRKSSLLAHEWLIRSPAPLDRHVFKVAESVWNEYFANRYSYSYASSPDVYPQHLAEVVPDLTSSISSAIRAYRVHSRLDDLLPFCEAKIGFLFQCFGYAAGHLLATDRTLHAVAPESHAALVSAGLIDIWDATVNELIRLDNCRDKWESFDEYQPLMAIVNRAFKVMNLIYSESKEGVYVNIPFTPKTMPLTR